VHQIGLVEPLREALGLVVPVVTFFRLRVCGTA
jgi:hypothetical protein